MVMNKKGAEMTLGTIIAIVLGIAVLVFLIFGFSSGWNNMWSKITQIGVGGSNIDDVVRGCEVACTSSSVYDYCTRQREVKLAKDDVTGDIVPGQKYTCQGLETKNVGLEPCDINCGSAVTQDSSNSATPTNK